MNLVFFGLSISSSWGNGHAATYRSLLAALHRRGHRVQFFERDVEWYASNRDLPQPAFAQLHLYQHWAGARRQAVAAGLAADAAIVGSYFPDAVSLIDALLDGGARVCFYDIDTPVTLAALAADDCAYLRARQIPGLAAYFSFTGGPVLAELERRWGARRALPLYCSVDTQPLSARRPAAGRPAVDLSYLGTFAPDRQLKFRRLLLEPAHRLPRRRFHVAGPLFPSPESWPVNVAYTFHLPPDRHSDFYGGSRFTLNLTRQAMVEAGYSPSVRLFEAAARGAPILTDRWPGLEEFFAPGEEILAVDDAVDVIDILTGLSPAEARALGDAARDRVCRCHSSDVRAAQLESYLGPADSSPSPAPHALTAASIESRR